MATFSCPNVSRVIVMSSSVCHWVSLSDKMSDRWERFVIWILSWICTGELCTALWHCELSKYLSAGRERVPDLIISFKYLLSSQQSWRIGQIKINDSTDVRFESDIKNTLCLGRRCWAVLLSHHMRLFWCNWGPNCGDNFKSVWRGSVKQILDILSQYKIDETNC